MFGLIKLKFADSRHTLGVGLCGDQINEKQQQHLLLAHLQRLVRAAAIEFGRGEDQRYIA